MPGQKGIPSWACPLCLALHVCVGPPACRVVREPQVHTLWPDLHQLVLGLAAVEQRLLSSQKMELGRSAMQGFCVFASSRQELTETWGSRGQSACKTTGLNKSGDLKTP